MHSSHFSSVSYSRAAPHISPQSPTPALLLTFLLFLLLPLLLTFLRSPMSATPHISPISFTSATPNVSCLSSSPSTPHLPPGSFIRLFLIFLPTLLFPLLLTVFSLSYSCYSSVLFSFFYSISTTFWTLPLPPRPIFFVTFSIEISFYHPVETGT
jgi:hypothetical protein